LKPSPNESSSGCFQKAKGPKLWGNIPLHSCQHPLAFLPGNAWRPSIFKLSWKGFSKRRMVTIVAYNVKKKNYIHFSNFILLFLMLASKRARSFIVLRVSSFILFCERKSNTLRETYLPEGFSLNLKKKSTNVADTLSPQNDWKNVLIQLQFFFFLNSYCFYECSNNNKQTLIITSQKREKEASLIKNIAGSPISHCFGDGLTLIFNLHFQ